MIVIVDGTFAAYALKIYITAERMRNWEGYYDKQISIKAMEKNWSSLLGLAKCIY